MFSGKVSERVVVLASGPLQKDGRFPDFYAGTYAGGHIRMEAAVKIAQLHPASRLTMVGGYNRTGNPRTGDKVNDMTKFILEQVPEAKVESIYSLPCTRHDITATLNTWRLNGENVPEVGILTNGYHLDRALHFAQEAAVQICPEREISFIPLPAEEILGRSIESIVGERMPEYYARLESEERGMQDIRTGDYKDSCLTNDPQAWKPVLDSFSNVLLAPTEQNYALSPIDSPLL